MTIPDEDPQASRPLPPRTLEELRRVVQLAREGGVELRLGPRSLAILEGMLERPEDVTLRSIAEIARAYGVSPSTLTRLARRLEFEGFKAFQRLFRLDVARSRHFYTEQAQRLIESAAGDEARQPGQPGSPGLEAARWELQNLAESVPLLDAVDIRGVRDAMLGASRLYVLGLRGCYSVAHYLGYYLGFLGKPVITLGASGFTLAEDVSDIGEGDVLIAVTVRPETRLTVGCCRLAGERGATVVTITNHHASPVRAHGRFNLYARCEGPYYFNPVAALFMVVEILLAEMAAALGEEMLTPLKRREATFDALGIE